jgi:predicted MFS family arabinose efflux permease
MMEYWKKIDLCLLLIFGLVGLERLTPGFVAPFIIKEFDLTYAQFGLCMALHAFSWSFGTFFAGLVADRIGKKPVIIFATLSAAAFSWITGMVQSFSQLLWVRGLIGIGMGGTMPPIAATITDETPLHLRGKVASLMGVFFILLGMVIGPVITTRLAQDFGWRVAFFLIGIPGFILGAVVWRIMQDRPRGEAQPSMMQGLKIVSRNRNIFLCMLLAICSLARIYIVVSFAVLFLTHVHGHSVTIAGLVFGIAAAGELLGVFSMGAVADALHRRKLIVVVSSAMACILGVVLAALPIGCPKSVLILVLFGFVFFSGGINLLVNILIPAESVGPAWAASAIGFSNAVGEFVGAGIFPIIGGRMGDVFGLGTTMMIGGWIMGLSAIIGLFLRETHPSGAQHLNPVQRA